MTSTHNDPILGIEQSEAFSCIGSACEDTCCAGWSIPVDRFSLEKWQKDDVFSQIRSHLKIVEHANPQNINAGHLQVLENGSCPFLDTQKLCALQSKKGHDFLSFTCRTFPRSRNTFYGIAEEYLSLACPEAARLILGSREKLRITLLNNAKEELPVYQYSIPPQNDIPAEQVWELRTLLYNFIQIDTVPLPHKLIVIGLIAKNIEESVAQGLSPSETYSKIIKKYTPLSKDPTHVKTLVQNIPSSTDLKVLFLKIITQILKKYSPAHTKYDLLVDHLISTFKINVSMSDEERKAHYENMNKTLSRESQLLLENYTFHLFFREVFPFSHANLTEHFSSLVLRIYLITHHLFSIADQEISRQIELIQKFSKLYENTPLLPQEILSITKSANFNSIAHTCILIND